MFFASQTNPVVNLALQGGGAHGALTWGVLDYLLEDGRVQFEGISGTSAGAMNAVVMANGLMRGGPVGARAALAEFWGAVATSLPFEIAHRTPDGEGITLSPSLKLLLRLSHHFSPEQLNPFDLNPLRDILTTHIDFERLRGESPVKLFIAATHANSGKLRVFRHDEISVDAVLASACLPTVHRAIEIDGEPYWDGGYSANPAIFPLFYECDSDDILLVLLTPLEHKKTPQSAQDIKNRILEIAFNSAFLREMLVFVQMHDYVSQSWLPMGRFERRVSRTRFHVIEAEELIAELPTETKLAANMWFFEKLRDVGRERAARWLETNCADVGRRSTVQLADLFC